jgi:glycosyltransferase involved in cell wall biosynthesis
MGQKKIFVVGPIIPFTGGMAQSNTVLCHNLSKHNDVTAISYSMMFPKLLYPGKKQRDGEPIRTKFKQEFILNTLNPISWINVLNKVRIQKPDWIVFQWWHTYFFPSYFFIAFFSKYLFNTKINVVCHHVLPNDVSKSDSNLTKRFIHLPLTKTFFSIANHLVVLSKSNVQILEQLMPKKKFDFMLDNSFSFLMKPSVSKSVARKKLRLPAKKILLSFGAVRPYKGVDDLIDAMHILSKWRNDVFLVVAGAFWVPVQKYIELAKELGVQDKVLFIDKYISDDEVPLFFCASDLVVLSHRTASQSAIPQMAFEYNVPMVATKVEGNLPFIDDTKTGLFFPPKNSKKMAETINLFFRKNLAAKFKMAMNEKSKILDWTDEKENLFFGGNNV